mmetsp:Transcript_666/g.1065  ORF Transcript_666/g.1065 Transcript_666/m.1065 type:complete len:97 (+) Transcript_666:47-337(+)
MSNINLFHCGIPSQYKKDSNGERVLEVQGYSEACLGYFSGIDGKGLRWHENGKIHALYLFKAYSTTMEESKGATMPFWSEGIVLVKSEHRSKFDKS